MDKIGLGGGCHWCTEAVFQQLLGVDKVEQGWIASAGKNSSFSEAVIVHFNPNKIDLAILIEIHLLTHSCTSSHQFRDKYRSAIYTFTDEQSIKGKTILKTLQANFNNKLITEILPFKAFKPNQEQFIDYYQKNPDKPFCQRFINPKLKLLLENFGDKVKGN